MILLWNLQIKPFIPSYYVSSGTYYFACDRSDRQHFSDRYVNPGADTYVCTEDRCSFCNADDLRTLDAEPDDESHGGYVVGLFCLYQVMDHDRV